MSDKPESTKDNDESPGQKRDPWQCMHCGGDARRESRGIETDWYRCESCGARFGIDWSGEQG